MFKINNLLLLIIIIYPYFINIYAQNLTGEQTTRCHGREFNSKYDNLITRENSYFLNNNLSSSAWGLTGSADFHRGVRQALPLLSNSSVIRLQNQQSSIANYRQNITVSEGNIYTLCGFMYSSVKGGVLSVTITDNQGTNSTRLFSTNPQVNFQGWSEFIFEYIAPVGATQVSFSLNNNYNLINNPEARQDIEQLKSGFLLIEGVQFFKASLINDRLAFKKKAKASTINTVKIDSWGNIKVGKDKRFWFGIYSSQFLCQAQATANPPRNLLNSIEECEHHLKTKYKEYADLGFDIFLGAASLGTISVVNESGLWSDFNIGNYRDFIGLSSLQRLRTEFSTLTPNQINRVLLYQLDNDWYWAHPDNSLLVDFHAQLPDSSKRPLYILNNHSGLARTFDTKAHLLGSYSNAVDNSLYPNASNMQLLQGISDTPAPVSFCHIIIGNNEQIKVRTSAELRRRIRNCIINGAKAISLFSDCTHPDICAIAPQNTNFANLSWWADIKEIINEVDQIYNRIEQRSVSEDVMYNPKIGIGLFKSGVFNLNKTLVVTNNTLQSISNAKICLKLSFLNRKAVNFYNENEVIRIRSSNDCPSPFNKELVINNLAVEDSKVFRMTL